MILVTSIAKLFTALTILLLGDDGKLQLTDLAGNFIPELPDHVSGITILSCVLLAALSNLLPSSVNADWPLLFIFEAVAVVAFGVSWFAKGHTIQGIQALMQRGATGAKTTAAARELEDHL